ncbi:uclacyanin 1-like [Phoenix dactylifera]|uniref:Uclacyanin 1-like n=1 Tax=Phoenix dactylifera TaxID=42345 RepID=A0A8B7D1L9_PHODC|nr:uclacyanin 1-like [Phoenix dactylifera]
MAALLWHRVVVAIATGVVVLATLGNGGGGIRTCGATQGVHHVVGGDPGWDAATDIAASPVNRIFRVGDRIWFAYSAAEESITELRSREEFESCDLRNPIKMFTEGLTKVSLDVEGSRYFTSSNPNNCKNGLKLHVEVQPQAAAQKEKKMEDVARAAAEGPKPSGSNCYQGSSLMWFASALIYFMCFPRI